MKINPNPLPVFSILNRKLKIDPKPQYQRGSVWSEANKQLLIDSILRGYDIPKFYLRVLNSGPYKHEVVDGQQRLRTLWEFCDNKFPLGDISKDIPNMNDLSGKLFKELRTDEQDGILSFVLTITEIRDSTEIEIRELFLRLQEGKSLLPPEKRNAMLGKMRDFIATLANHQVFLKTYITNSRFDYDDWAAHIVCIELNNGPIDVKATDLKKMYETEVDFDLSSMKAIKVKKVLNYLDKILSQPTPEMKIKWGFVDLYLLISKLIDSYDLKDRHLDFHDFFVGFDNERRSITEPADLISGTYTPWDKDLYDYCRFPA